MTTEQLRGMADEAFVEILAQRVVEKLLARQKQALVVYTGSNIGEDAALEAMGRLRGEGYKVGFVRPKTLNPFPYDTYDVLDYGRVRAILDVEMSIPAQMVRDVELAVSRRCPIETCLHAGGEIMGREEVIRAAKALLDR